MSIGKRKLCKGFFITMIVIKKNKNTLTFWFGFFLNLLFHRDSAPQKSFETKNIYDLLVSSPEDKANQSLGDLMSSVGGGQSLV